MQRPGIKTVDGMSHADLTKFVHNILATQNPDKSASLQQMDVHGVLNVKDKINLSPQAAASIGVSPTGAITAFAAGAIPKGWLLCDGSAVSRSNFSALFALIGVTYGAGDGSTTFNVPNLQGRVPVGKNAGTFPALAGTGGEETHLLTSAEMPSHTHAFSGTALPTHTHTGTTSTESGDHTHTFPISTAAGGTTTGAAPGGTTISTNKATSGRSTSHTHTFTTDAASAGTPAGTNASTGGGGAHNNLQPYLVVNYIIKS